MSKVLIILFSFPLLFSSCRAQEHFESVAVVELFTSEGCSSCPPADRLLGDITAASERDHTRVVTLSFHVDYWDRLGWRDPFSSSQYSERQGQYAEVLHLRGSYTPEAVVNGTKEMVGSDADALHRAITEALQAKAYATFTTLKIGVTKPDQLSVSYETQGDLRDCIVHLALVTKHESTAVKRGENEGRQLTHTDVVRQFISMVATRGEADFDISAYPDHGNLMVIAYVQREKDMHIIAAAKATL